MQEYASFSIEGQEINIWGFVGQHTVSATHSSCVLFHVHMFSPLQSFRYKIHAKGNC